MNLADIAILVVLAAFLLKGLFRGLLKEVCSLLGLLVGAFLAFRYHPPLAEGLVSAFGLPSQLCVVIAFMAIFLTSVVVFALIGYLLSRFVKLIFLGGFNRVAGGFFGLAQGGVLMALVLFAFSVADLPGPIDRILKISQLSPPFIELGEAIFRGSLELLSGPPR